MSRKKFRKRKHYVYGLVDPFDLKIKYIGLTSNCKSRYKHHRTAIYYEHNEKLLTWICDLRDKGSYPEFKILKEVNSYEVGHKIEIMLINKMGNQLFNKHHNNG